MDILFSVVNSDKKELTYFIQQISNSNIEKSIQEDIIYVLQTVIEQTDQAKRMGWI
jgi:hypothetical protein